VKLLVLEAFFPTLELASLRSISGVFETLHGFNIGQVGSVFATMTLVAISPSALTIVDLTHPAPVESARASALCQICTKRHSISRCITKPNGLANLRYLV
jgi:hypothetical protein